MLIKKLSALNENQLQRLVTLFGALIACQVIYIQHGWINDDSVLYFEMARLFSIGEWKQGIALFNWPLYPALISSIHQITNLEIQTSAQILNVIFFAITTYSFISLIKLAGGNKITIICGGFLLLSSAYIVGDVLPMLLRDQGFWAMFLTSLVYFIKFYRDKKLNYALLWQICAILAVLFRIEAITYLVCLPLLVFTESQYSIKQKFKYYSQLNLLSIVALMIIASALVISPSVHLNDFGRIQEVVTIFPRMLNDVTQAFIAKANIMNKEVLSSFLDDYGMTGLIVTLASILIAKILKLLGLPILAIFALSHLNRQHANASQLISQDCRQILYWTLILTVINACVIIASVFVLSGRYIIALGLIFIIFAAFHFSVLVESLFRKKIKKTWQKILLLIIFSWLTLSTIKNILPKSEGYNFEQNAVAYLKKQKIPNEKVFFVTPRSRYFAGAPFAGRGYEYWDFTQNAISNDSIYNYDYLMISLPIDAELDVKQKFLSEKLTHYQVEKEFYGLRKKKKISLYVKK